MSEWERERECFAKVRGESGRRAVEKLSFSWSLEKEGREERRKSVRKTNNCEGGRKEGKKQRK